MHHHLHNKIWKTIFFSVLNDKTDYRNWYFNDNLISVISSDNNITMHCLQKTNFVWLYCYTRYICLNLPYHLYLHACVVQTNSVSSKLILTCHLSWSHQLQFLWFVEQWTNATLFLLVYMPYESTCWPMFISTGIFEALVSQRLSLNIFGNVYLCIFGVSFYITFITFSQMSKL